MCVSAVACIVWLVGRAVVSQTRKSFCKKDEEEGGGRGLTNVLAAGGPVLRLEELDKLLLVWCLWRREGARVGRRQRLGKIRLHRLPREKMKAALRETAAHATTFLEDRRKRSRHATGAFTPPTSITTRSRLAC